MPEPQGNSHSHALALPDGSGAVPTSTEARAKRHIAALEEELNMMKQERGTKQRFVVFTHHFTHYVSCLLIVKGKQPTSLLKAGQFTRWLSYTPA
jgi:hypothetical protein